MDALMQRLAEALRVHGLQTAENESLEGRSGSVYNVPLLVEGDQAFVIDAHLDGVVPAEALQGLGDVAEDVGADGGILCHLEASESCDVPNVQLWGADDLRRILGAAALAELTAIAPEPLQFHREEKPDLAPIADSLEDLLPPAFTPDFTEADEADDAVGSEPEDLFAGLGEAFAEAEVADEPAAFDVGALESLGGLDFVEDEPAAPMPEPAVQPQFAHQLLPVRITPEEAMLQARERLFEADRVARILQPVHLVDYECDLLAEGSLRYDTISGRLQIHGTNKETIEVDRDSVDPSAFSKEVPEVPAEERTLRVSQERARERSTAFLMENHTRVVDVSVHDEEGSFDYTEKKKVAPRPDHVRLNPLGVYHRVVWRVIGPNGHVDIDAITGLSVEEQLATPDPGTIILD